MNDQYDEPLFTVEDSEIDVEAIMAEIRRRIAERRATQGLPRRVFPSFEGAALPEMPEDDSFDATLYHHLRLLNETYFAVPVEPVLAPSPATALPIVGRLWQRIRHHLHGLVLFYVNRLATHQTTINRHLVSILNRLVAENIALRRRLRELEEAHARDRHESS